MPQIEINDPLTAPSKPPAFDVEGWSDAPNGTVVTCTITKGAFNQTGTGPVPASGNWTVPLAGIPPGLDYAITATINTGGVASADVDEIDIVANPGPAIAIDSARFFKEDDGSRSL